MAAKSKRKKKVKPAAAGGARCPRCKKRAELLWHGRRELCQACIDAIRAPVETEPITVGSLLRGTFHLLRRVGLPALLITIAFELPLAALTVLSDAGPAVGALWSLVSLVGIGMVIDVALQRVTQERVSIAEAARTSTRAYIGLLFASLIASLIVAVFTILLVVPGVLRLLSYAIVLPLIIDGDARSTDALGVSADRMKGHRWPAFLALAVAYALPAAWFALNLDIALGGLAIDAEAYAGSELRAGTYTLVLGVLMIPITVLGVVLHLKLRRPTPA